MKFESVFTPAEWMAIAKRARKKHKFDVLLEARDFLEFKSLKELIVNRLTPQRRWIGLRSVVYAFRKMSHTRFFTSMPWMMLGSNVLTYQRGRPVLPFAVNLPLLHPDGCKISLAKHRDIMSFISMSHLVTMHSIRH